MLLATTVIFLLFQFVRCFKSRQVNPQFINLIKCHIALANTALLAWDKNKEWWSRIKNKKVSREYDSYLIFQLLFVYLIYNKPTRSNSGSIVFINNYKYAVHISGAL